MSFSDVVDILKIDCALINFDLKLVVLGSLLHIVDGFCASKSFRGRINFVKNYSISYMAIMAVRIAGYIKENVC